MAGQMGVRLHQSGLEAFCEDMVIFSSSGIVPSVTLSFE